MGEVKKIIQLFSKFYLEKIGNDWVTSITDCDFTEVEDLPIEFEEFHASTNFVALLNETAKLLRDWIDIFPESDFNSSATQIRKASLTCLSTSSIYEEEVNNRNVYSQFWVDLTSNVNTKALLSFLFYHSYKAQHYDANEERREIGVLSSSLYFLLLCVPGSNAFGLFHPVLYLKCLDIMRLTTKLNIGAASPKKKGGKFVRRSTDELIGNDDDEEELSYLSSHETSKLIRSLNILLNDFLRFSKKFSLKHSTESLEETLSILVEVTKSELHNASGIFIKRHAANTVSALTYNAYVALQEMCSPLHGNVNKTIKLIMKFIMPNILMTARGTSDLSLRALGVIREHSVIFVKYLFTQMKEEATNGVFILLQHLCVRVTDKADYREKTARSVVDILHIFPINFYTNFIEWLYRFSHNEKAGHRLFTLEIISKLLDQDERTNDNEENKVVPNSNLVGENINSSEEPNSFGTVQSDHNAQNEALKQNVLSHKFLLGIIFSRCRDSAATVRAKALSLLAGCTLSNNTTISASMKEIFFGSADAVFQTPHIDDANINCESPADIRDNTANLEFPNADMIFSLLRRRAVDARVTVRRSALQVIENLIKLDKTFSTPTNLKILVLHCRDFALFIRKQMIVSLTAILDVYPNSELVIKMWVSGILPLILDPEVKVQEKVLEVVDSSLFSSLERYREENTHERSRLPWKILNAVTSLSYHKFFSKVLMLWCKSEFIKPNIIATVKTYIGTSVNEEAWTLLAILSPYMVFKEPIFALEYFEQHCNDITQISSYTLQQVLKILQNSIKHLPQDRALNLQKQLLDYIESFQLEVELISVVIDCITLITYSIHGEESEGQLQIEKWAAPILKNCEQYLKNILFPLNEILLSKDEEELFFRNLFTLGETSLLCPSKVNKRMFLMLQSLIFHETQSKDVPVKVPSSQTQSSQPPAVSFKPTTRLKALAVVTVGKMCLQHEDQAKRIIPALGKMLEVTAGSSIKINTIFVLSDMCVRYATLVDPLIPQITGCLRDPDVQVRKTTLTLLISLLQEDYLKLKGSFFYRILQCLCDDHEDIKSTVIFFMTERLLKRFPNVFLQHFIECIFHYNCYEEHESYNRFVQSEQEKELFSLAGPEHRQERMKLYCFMLEHMSDDQRFATTQKLCQDVLGGILGGRIKLTPSSQLVLEDTLVVLSSEEIKLAFLKSSPEDTDQPTDRAEKQALTGIIVKRTIVSQVVKQNVIENIIPILISLKHRLEEQRSPLMKQLLLYIKEIMKDYKNEVKEILAGDKQLAKEIEFDLRRIEKEQQHKEEEEPQRQNSLLSTAREGNRQNKGGSYSPQHRPTVCSELEVDKITMKMPVVHLRKMPASLLKTVLLSNQRRKSVCVANTAPLERVIPKKRSRSLERELELENNLVDNGEHVMDENCDVNEDAVADRGDISNDVNEDDVADRGNISNDVNEDAVADRGDISNTDKETSSLEHIDDNINESSAESTNGKKDGVNSRKDNITDGESISDEKSTEDNIDDDVYREKNIEDKPMQEANSRQEIKDKSIEETQEKDKLREANSEDKSVTKNVEEDLDDKAREKVNEDVKSTTENIDEYKSAEEIMEEKNSKQNTSDDDSNANETNFNKNNGNRGKNKSRNYSIQEVPKESDVNDGNAKDNIASTAIVSAAEQGKHLEEVAASGSKKRSKRNRKGVKINEDIDNRFSSTVLITKKRDKFLRAISTPQRDMSILQNITFINKSHEVSAIGLDSLQDSSELDRDTHSFLQLKTPDAKDEQFSQLRRNARRSSSKKVQPPGNNSITEETRPQGKTKRASGEALFESFNSQHNTEPSTLNDSSRLSDTFCKPFSQAGTSQIKPQRSKKNSRSSSSGKRKSPIKRKRPRYK